MTDLIGLNKRATAVLRAAGVAPATWARANYMASGTWSGDACGCPDGGRCMNGYHHYPDDECGCLQTLLSSYVAGEGQFDGESGYVISDPLWAQVRRARRRAGLHSGKPPSERGRALAALDKALKLANGWKDEAAKLEPSGADAVQPAMPGNYLATGRLGALEDCAGQLREAITQALIEGADGGPA